MKPRFQLALLAVVIAIAVSLSFQSGTPAARSPRFIGLGDLPGGRFFSAASSISADGTIVAGYSHSASGEEAFHWSTTHGIEPLGFARAAAVSADGLTIVGYRRANHCVEPVRWTTRRGIERLQHLAEYPTGQASGVSANGTTIVGDVSPGQNDFDAPDVAFRWTSEGAALLPLAAGTIAERSEPNAISADGAVIVGKRRNAFGHDEAFRWTAKSGPVALGYLPGHTTSVAYAVSADGAVVVGCSSDYTTREAFRWTAETGMVRLGTLATSSCDGAAHGVSADGSVIVGYSAGKNGWDAFIWDASRGMRSIRDVLDSEFHLANTLRGWKLRAAMAVSADGTVVVGFGVNRDGNPEAWLARLGNPMTAIEPRSPLAAVPTAALSTTDRY